jgi:hypothetical protein
MREIGLNRRATELRERLGLRPRKRAGAGREPMRSSRGSGLARAARLRAAMNDDGSQAGISADDRMEIQNKIDELSRRHRISAGSTDFIVRPRRKGFVFPFAVNILALASTVGAVFLLSYVFRQRDLDVSGSAGMMDTAEGKLLRELKRDSESRLQEKDKAIADIQSRLGSLDKERKELAANIDAKIVAREAELRAGLQAELEAEKKKLGDRGLSATALDARLKSFEAERTLALNKELEDARKEAAAEKGAAEEKYSQLRDEYRKSMAGLGEERKRIQDQAARREDELRISMESAAKDLESQSAAAKAGLEGARAELAALQDQRARAKAEEDRVIGLYGTIRAALRDLRFADASAGAAALVSFLNDPKLDSDASIQDRRDADLFVAETIGAYARGELERSSVDATGLLRQAEILAAAREAAAAAQAALKAGDAALASAKYGEALAKVPEILAAHEYFISQEQAAEAARRTRLGEALTAAEAAFSAGDRAATLAKYAEALSYLPIDEAVRKTMVARLVRSGQEGSQAPVEADAARKAADTRAAAPLLAAASRRLDAKDWSGAISSLVDLLSSYPQAEQSGAALKQIAAARDGLRDAADAAEAAARSEAKVRSESAQAAALEATKASARAAARENALAMELVDAKKSIEILRSNIDALNATLAETQAKTAQAALAANPGIDAAAQAAQAGEIEKLRAEVARLTDESARAAADAERFRAGASKYEAIVSAYREFLNNESEAAKKGGKAAVLALQSSLFAFLGEAGVSEALPGLRDKLAAYQDASRSELLVAFPSDAAEIVQQAMSYSNKAALRTYYATRRDTYQKSGNFLMINFIDAISKVIY